MKTPTDCNPKQLRVRADESISYPKAHKGEKAVAKPIKELPTYSKHIFGALNNAAKYTRLGFVLVKLVWSAWHCFRWNYLEVLQIN